MTEQQFKEITEWQKATFPKADANSKISHLKQEVNELAIAISCEDHHLTGHQKLRETKMGFADCFFLLFGGASAYGMTYQDIVSAINEKFEINKARKWGKPDENGVVNHIKNT